MQLEISHSVYEYDAQQQLRQYQEIGGEKSSAMKAFNTEVYVPGLISDNIIMSRKPGRWELSECL